jgi:hypothetical protein
MIFIRPSLTAAETPHITFSSDGQSDGVTVAFAFHGKYSRREATAQILRVLTVAKIEWMQLVGGRWMIDADVLKRSYPVHFENQDWFAGKVEVELEFENVLQEPRPETPDPDGVLVRYPVYKRYITECKFLANEEIVLEQAPKKIFLSHKSTDKGQVRRFKAALEAVGFEVWLDEDAMTAGAELERSLIKGFKDSRAAVFFITPNYVDDNYLATEVDYAVAEKRDKRDGFSIITLVFKDDQGKEGQVPALLRKYVWKQPADELSAFVEIVRALPISPTIR